MTRWINRKNGISNALFMIVTECCLIRLMQTGACIIRLLKGVEDSLSMMTEIRYCHTHTVFESIAHIFRTDAGAEQKGIEFFRDFIDFRDFIIYLEMEPNIKETLAILRGRGIHTAISTNRTTSMRHIMSRYGLWEFFDVVVTAAHQIKRDWDEPDEREILQARSKPDPEGVAKILQALNVRPEATLYIGDSEIDMGTARSAGVKFIAYKNSTMPADAVINDHLALLDFLADG